MSILRFLSDSNGLKKRNALDVPFVRLFAAIVSVVNLTQLLLDFTVKSWE